MANLDRIDYKRLLKQFQQEEQRMAEESFAVMFSERPDTRVFFINEDQAFTDGKNIVVDPAFYDLYKDTFALRRSEQLLGMPADLSRNPWLALHFVTRALNIHECLHLLYTRFPVVKPGESRIQGKNEQKVFGLINNIIEDRYIEDLGKALYPRLGLYLEFLDVAHVFAKKKGKGTAETQLDFLQSREGLDENAINDAPNRDEETEQTLPESAQKTFKLKCLLYFLERMGIELLMEFFTVEEDPFWHGFVEQALAKARPFFTKAMSAAEPEARYQYALDVLDIVRAWIPEDDEDFSHERLDAILGAHAKTHRTEANSPLAFTSEGLAQEIPARNAEEEKQDKAEAMEAWFVQRNAWVEEADTLGVFTADGKNKPDSESTDTVVIPGGNFRFSNLHNKVFVEVSKPKPDAGMRVAYQNIVRQYQLSISSYRRRFTQLLKGTRSEAEHRKLFGQGISSKHLGDVKKRFWYKKSLDSGVPDLAITLLIDGSGSMSGERIRQARDSAIILFEVLKTHGLPLSVIQHSAYWKEPRIACELLLPFGNNVKQALNLMRIGCKGSNRDGLALQWAARYLFQNSPAEENLLLVISDGAPVHVINDDDSYLPPASVKDTASIVRQLEAKGLQIIAIALDSGGSPCYEEVKEIYNNCIRCNDLSKLTAQLLSLISRLLG